jgi:hypothetical protein
MNTDLENQYDFDARCEICGRLGAYDFVGEMICACCAQPPVDDDEDVAAGEDE